MMTLPIERPITPLRHRMLDEMTMRAMRARTQHDYVRHVCAFAAFEPTDVRAPCPCCGGHMVIIETFERWRQPRAPPHGTASTGTTTS